MAGPAAHGHSKEEEEEEEEGCCFFQVRGGGLLFSWTWLEYRLVMYTFKPRRNKMCQYKRRVNETCKV